MTPQLLRPLYTVQYSFLGFFQGLEAAATQAFQSWSARRRRGACRDLFDLQAGRGRKLCRCLLPLLRRIGQARVGAPLELPEVEAVQREQEHHRREPEVGGEALLAIAPHLGDADDAKGPGVRLKQRQR